MNHPPSLGMYEEMPRIAVFHSSTDPQERYYCPGTLRSAVPLLAAHCAARLLRDLEDLSVYVVAVALSWPRPVPTCQPLRTNYRLQNGHDGGQPPPDLFVLGLDRIFLPNHRLELLVRLLGGQFFYPALQTFNVLLRPFSDGTLRLAVIGALFRELFRSQARDAARAGRRLALAACLVRRRGCKVASWRGGVGGIMIILHGILLYQR